MIEIKEHDFTHLKVDEIIKKFDSDLTNGLDDKVVEERLSIYGPNELPQEEKTSIFKLFIEQFEDTLVRILLVAAIVSAFLGLTESHKHILDAMIEPLVIIIVLIVNATISVRQTISAEEAIEALKQYEPETAKVRRKKDSTLVEIKANQLVVGDIVEVRVGDRVPADIRVCEIHSTILRADQSILTGESLSVIKVSVPITVDKPLNQDKVNILFSGTNIVAGRAFGIVVATGCNTQIGKIRDNIANTESARTPLQIKLDEFGNQLSLIISIICVLVWVINIHHFDDPFHGGSWFKGAVYYFKIAISLAVAAIPEGLPAVITTCLAIGTRRMAKKNAIVRSLRSVETLGCTSVICSDKTGTITTNQMAIQKLCIAEHSNITGNTNLEEYDISGISYDPRDGKIAKRAELVSKNHKLMTYVSNICCLCNDAGLTVADDNVTVRRVGEATEAALLVLAEKLNIFNIDTNGMDLKKQIIATMEQTNKHFTKKTILEFSRDRKSMSVFCEDKAVHGRDILFVKGSPEDILQRCDYIMVGDSQIPLRQELRAKIMAKFQSYGSGKSTLRCLALSYREMDRKLFNSKNTDETQFKSIESQMTFVGLVGMLDPPRAEVSVALKQCSDAGIRVIVITGDTKSTAESICCRIGMFQEGEDLSKLSYSGQDFDKLTPEQKLDACSRGRLFSRVEPRHKSEIVTCLQKLGEITAMTGDGVNDAPALKKAEIGIAMGSGTAVAKSSSDIVLADDNFSTIVSAVSEGRAIFLNTVQFISYLVSSNIGEVVCIFLTSMMGLPEGLIPVQLLWVNLITDGLPATALGFNPPPDNIMFYPPRNPKAPLIGKWQILRYSTIGLYVGVSTVAASVWWYLYDPTGPALTFKHLIYHQSCSVHEPMYVGIDCELFNHFTPMTIALSVLVLTEMFNACNSMSETQSILKVSPFRNVFLILAVLSSMLIHLVTLHLPLTQRLFSVTPLTFHQWQIVFFFSFPVVILDECLKFVYRLLYSPEKVKKS